MTPEERELLTRSIKLAEENNKILRGMRRNARFSSVLRVIYWIVILGSIFASYYIIKPFIDPLINSYKGLQENIETVKNVTNKLPSSWLNN